jgi:periplasmic divalent cation tolerance protein
MDTTFSLVFCAAGSKENADAIAATLVERRLAACVQLGAIESYYRWRGAVEHESEWLLQIKTTSARVPAVEGCIKELHTYELPEISSVPLSGSREYLTWIADAVG